ncbi:MBL fold metallo-hydrolase [Aureibacillus halotolerans]|uniref:Ribonuclease BN (tRNA processing enzyme) n=1 Tax=Aureibacillus halotolerans TaxID=1508390 RepID=A0A4R6UAT9_9BACI|nr:MBL fold metallo-hydrolase [Aureibacillus halotolerans]TDQ42029.1 ribonuclease BN (tRNA processing enzyme) [Aureibacillus halotolerans]
MKVTVLGKWGAYPEADGATAGYLYEQDGFHLLVDCGSGVLAQLQKYINVNDLDAVVLSHTHQDHMADIGPLHYASLIQHSLGHRDTVLPVYTAPVDVEKISSIADTPWMDVIEYNPQSELNVGPFTMLFSETEHPVPCQAIRLSAGGTNVGYTADTSWLDKWPTFFKGVDLLIAECSFYDGQDSKVAGHLTSTECGQLARECEAGELILTHLPHFGEHDTLLEEAKAQFDGRVLLAQTGQVWEK